MFKRTISKFTTTVAIVHATTPASTMITAMILALAMSAALATILSMAIITIAPGTELAMKNGLAMVALLEVWTAIVFTISIIMATIAVSTTLIRNRFSTDVLIDFHGC